VSRIAINTGTPINFEFFVFLITSIPSNNLIFAFFSVKIAAIYPEFQIISFLQHLMKYILLIKPNIAPGKSEAVYLISGQLTG